MSRPAVKVDELRAEEKLSLIGELGRATLVSWLFALWACSSTAPNAPDAQGGQGGETASLETCSATPEASPVDAYLIPSCMPETFDVQATLSELRMEFEGTSFESTTRVAHASFDVLEDLERRFGCDSDAPQLVGYNGPLPPGLTVGATYRVQGWHNLSDARNQESIVVLRDANDVLIVGWYWQNVEYLNEGTFAPELGLSFSVQPLCQQPEDCVTTRIYNSLIVERGGARQQLEIADTYEFQHGGESYTLGLNGGTNRLGPIKRGCFDVDLGSDTIFAVLRM